MRVVQLLSYACVAAAQSYPNTTTVNNGTVSSLSQNTTSQTRASVSTIASSLTSHAAGFFIAAGVGLSSTTPTDQSPSLTLRLTTSTFAGTVLTSNTSTVSTGTEVISISNVSDSRTGPGSQGALFSGTPTEGVTYSNTTRQQSTSVARLSAVNGTLKSSHSGNVFTTTFTSYYNATYAKVTETLTNNFVGNGLQCRSVLGRMAVILEVASSNTRFAGPEFGIGDLYHDPAADLYGDFAHHIESLHFDTDDHLDSTDRHHSRRLYANRSPKCSNIDDNMVDVRGPDRDHYHDRFCDLDWSVRDFHYSQFDGGVVQLLYFPPGLSHPATGPVIATTLGTTLTSPTNYISFESLYASDVCSGVGRTITSTILAIPESHTMSSLFATTKGCFAHLLNNPWYGTTVVGTASFNVSDLVHDTVPYSIYTSQPRCASEMFHAGCNPNVCRTDLPYQPLIVLEPGLLQELDPAWAPCSMDLRGLYDPPKALVPATAVAGVSTASDTTATVTATPGVSMSSPTPTATGGALPALTTTKVSAAPKQRTSSTSLPIEQPSSNGKSPVATVVETSAAAQPAPGNTVPVASGQGETSAQGSGNTPIPQDPRASLVISTPAATTVPAAGAAGPANPEPTSVTLVAGQTLQPGGSAVVVSGTTFTALPGGNGVGAIAQGTTSTITPTSAPSQAPVSNTNSAVVNAGTTPTNGSPQAQPSATVIAGQTLSPGGASVVLSGTTFSALPGTSGVAPVAQGTTRTITPAPAPSGDPATTANGPIVVAANSPGNGSPPAQSSVTVVAGQLLSAGGSAIVVSGTTFTALPGSSGVAAVAHGSTKIISAIASTTGGSNIASAGPSVVAVPANPAAENLVTIAIPSTGAAAARITLSDGQIITAAAATTLAPEATTLVRNGATLTLSRQSGNLVVNGKTIVPGAAATMVNGVALSVDPSGQLVDLGHTNIIATGSVPGTFIVDGNVLSPGDPAINIGDETFSVNAAGHLVEIQSSKTMTFAPGNTNGVMVVDGTTLSAGGSPVTIGDEVYTVYSAGQLLEVAPATTLALPQVAAVVEDGTTFRLGAPAQTIAGEVLSVNAAGQLVQINDPHDPGSLVSVIAGIVAAAAQATGVQETATAGSQSHSTTIGIGSEVGSSGISTADPAAASTAAGSNSSGGARLLSGSLGLFGVVVLMLVGLKI
ncbi:hypothetical protein LTR95_000264 [Oleoguttula sp. CCFEE 5521]